MGQEIGNELDEQNGIIDGLAYLVRNTDNTRHTKTRRVTTMDRKSKSRGMIMVISLLLMAMVGVQVCPAK